MPDICPECKTEFQEGEIKPESYPIAKICLRCNGKGAHGELNTNTQCSCCTGRGGYANPNTLPFFIECSVCRGTGYGKKFLCLECTGDRIVRCIEQSLFCPKCEKNKGGQCSNCDGLGVIDLEGNLPSVYPRTYRCDFCYGKGSYSLIIKVDIKTGKRIEFKEGEIARELS